MAKRLKHDIYKVKLLEYFAIINLFKHISSTLYPCMIIYEIIKI